MKKLTPLHDRVLIKRIDSEETTRGGIIIPDNAKEKPQEGEIVAVGTGKLMDDGTKREMSVKPGDRVLFAKYAETEVKLDGESLLLMREDDIMGVLA